MPLRHEKELVAVEYRAAEHGEAVLADDGFGVAKLVGTGVAIERELIDAVDLLREVVARFFRVEKLDD